MSRIIAVTLVGLMGGIGLFIFLVMAGVPFAWLVLPVLIPVWIIVVLNDQKQYEERSRNQDGKDE